MATYTNFKFGTHAPRQNPDVTPESNSGKRGTVSVTWCRKITWRRCTLTSAF